MGKIKERSAAEKQKRIENYKAQREKMLAEGYREQVGVISIAKANVMAFVTAGPFALIAIVIYFLKNSGGKAFLAGNDFLSLAILLLICIPIHELIHGIAWSLFCKEGWKSIGFGVMWEYLTPYCHCKEPLSFRGYICGGLAPFMVLGIGGLILALVNESPMLLYLSVFNILSAGGDTTIALMLFKHTRAKILDHPSECGFVAFEK